LDAGGDGGGGGGVEAVVGAIQEFLEGGVACEVKCGVGEGGVRRSGVSCIRVRFDVEGWRANV
jgi:hypothetical protein